MQTVSSGRLVNHNALFECKLDLLFVLSKQGVNKQTQVSECVVDVGETGFMHLCSRRKTCSTTPGMCMYDSVHGSGQRYINHVQVKRSTQVFR